MSQSILILENSSLCPPGRLHDVLADRRVPHTLVRLHEGEQVPSFDERQTSLEMELKAAGDPRMVGGGEKFDTYRYLGGAPKWPGKK